MSVIDQRCHYEECGVDVSWGAMKDVSAKDIVVSMCDRSADELWNLALIAVNEHEKEEHCL